MSVLRAECSVCKQVSSNLFTYSHNYVLLAVDCGSLNNIANGLVSTSSGTTFMMTATYTCNTGYLRVIGSQSRTCETNGTSGVWSGEAPVCNCKTSLHTNRTCALTFCFSPITSDSFKQCIGYFYQQLCHITGDHWILCFHLSH